MIAGMSRVLAFLLAIAGFGSASAQPTIVLEAEGGRFHQLEEGAMAWIPDDDGTPRPLLVVLHGAGGNAATSLQPVLGEASRRRISVVAVKSGGRTWDALEAMRGSEVGGFSGGAARLPSGDRKRIERAVEAVAGVGQIDETRLALFGFSDGASMALSLGLKDPSAYPHVIAFAPGGVIPAKGGKDAKEQRVLIAHGTADTIIPYAHDLGHVCPKVERSGRAVRFITFEGGHRVEQTALGQALDHFLDPSQAVGIEGCPR